MGYGALADVGSGREGGAFLTAGGGLWETVRPSVGLGRRAEHAHIARGATVSGNTCVALHTSGCRRTARRAPATSGQLALPVGLAQGTDLPEYRQGQLLLSGPSLTDGYLTANGPAVENPRNGWPYSGDLGFFADGELFVTGRIKDLIIIAGRNYLPYSLEEAAANLDGVRSGAVAALGIPHPETGAESFALVAESPAS